MTALYLLGAILSEVSATLALRAATQPRGARAWLALVAVGYLASFVLLTLALRAGLAVGVAYGVWAATGVVLTAVASRLLFREPLTRVMALGMGLVVAGVLLVEAGATH